MQMVSSTSDDRPITDKLRQWLFHVLYMSLRVLNLGGSKMGAYVYQSPDGTTWPDAWLTQEYTQCQFIEDLTT
jgi:hypothetical protein